MADLREEKQESSQVVQQQLTEDTAAQQPVLLPPNPSKYPVAIIVSYDLETTGLKVFEDRITEVGTASAVVFNDHTSSLLATFVEYVRVVDRNISIKSQRITGITEQKLAAACLIDTVFDHFANYVSNICKDFPENLPRVFVGHNIKKFDLPMKIAELERCRKSSALHYMRKLKFEYLLDTVTMSKDVVDTLVLPRDKNGKPCYKLGGIYEALFQRPLVGAHGALADCSAVLELLLQQECFKTAFFADFESPSPQKKYLTNPIDLVTETIASIPKTAGAINLKQNPSKKMKTMGEFFAPASTSSNPPK